MVDDQQFRDKYWHCSPKLKGWGWARHLDGNYANNTIEVGDGNDLIFLSAGGDIIDGGPDNETSLIGSRQVYGYSSEVGEAVPSFAI